MRSYIYKLWRWGRWPLAMLLAIALYFAVLFAFDNFHAVVPGEVYRSAQLKSDDWERVQQRHGIRSIINLRGDNTGHAWYDHEVAEAKRLGIAHYNFRMSMKRELTDAQVDELLSLMRKAPKPLLIKCRSGADRTGLVAALYRAAIQKESKARAEHELWAMYGHFALSWRRAYAMDRTFEAQAERLNFIDIQP